MPLIQLSTLSIMMDRIGQSKKPICNLRCPFCISHMSYQVEPPTDKKLTPDRIRYLADKFYAVRQGIPYAILTGKGEPTLGKKEELGEIIYLLRNLYGPGKGLVPELQTNGTRLNRENLRFWHDQGLNTVAMSCVSHLPEVNSRLLSGGSLHWDLGMAARQANDIGLLVRLTVTLTKGGVDSVDAFFVFMKWAKEVGAHQVTFRNMGQPRNLALLGSTAVADWIKSNFVDGRFVIRLLKEQGIKEEVWPWALKFNYNGISLVVTDCLTPPKDGVVRHAVIQPNGHLYGSWDDPADIII